MVQVTNSKDEPDRFSSVRTFGLVIARIDDSSKEEEEMTLNRKKGLKELLTGRNKGTSGSQPLPALPLSSSFHSRPTPHTQPKEEKEGKGDSQGRGGGPPKGAQAVENGQGQRVGLLGEE